MYPWIAIAGFSASILVFGVAGCGDDEVTGPGGAGGGAGGSGGAGGTGTTVTSGGLTLEEPQAGLTGCAEIFVDDDGECRPSLAKCGLGEVPDLETGCVAVGVTDCAAAFVDERGLCLPAVSACEEGSFPVPTLGCVALDGPMGCGAGTWGNVPDAPENVYVDASFAGEASDGTKTAPFTTLADALASIGSSGRIVLAAGTYTADLTISSGVEVRGVCASQVTLTAPDTAERVLAIDPGPGQLVALADLTVSASVGGVRVTSGEATLSRVRIRDVGYMALQSFGGSTVVTIEDSVVEDTTNFGADAIGIGLQARSGGQLTVRRSAVLRTRSAALSAVAGDLVAEDIFVADTKADSTGAGYAAASMSGGSLVLRRAVLVGNLQGIYAANEATIEDSVLGPTISPSSDRATLVDGAFSLVRSAVVDGTTWGVTSYDGQTGPVLIEHALFADVGSGAFGGSSISLDEGGSVRRSAFVRNTGPSLTVANDSEVDGIVVEDGRFDSSLGVGSGISIASSDGMVTVDRAYVRGVEDVALQVGAYEGTAGTVVIKRSRFESLPGVDGNLGLGIGLAAPTMAVTVEDTVIEGAHAAGIESVDTTLAMRRSVVRDVALGKTNNLQDGVSTVGPIGDGVLFLDDSGGHGLTLEDVWLEGATRVGVMAKTGTHSLTRVRVLGSDVGVASRDGATMTRTDCDLGGNGVEVEDPSTLVVP
ncbi:MAG: hypothetical protein JNL21_14880 [Myxococcales bacterium]|nr:hypothetical protein [Myxococcales bacterium]